MHPNVIGLVVFACTFGGVLVGMWLRSALPPNHLSPESRDTVRVGIGLIATMTALVLGLVTASAKSSFDAVDSAVKQTAIEILALDRLLARYGSETAEIRTSLKNVVGTRIEMIWPQDATKQVNLDPIQSGVGAIAEGLTDSIRSLQPQNESQRTLQSRAIDRAEALLQARWLVMAGNESSVPLPFLVILLFWLTITFLSFGLYAPGNATVLAVLVVCALSVGSAVFLVLEMDAPFAGMLKVSSEPLEYAYSHLNQ